MEFLRSFLRRHLAGKPLVASSNVVCFLRLVLKKVDCNIVQKVMYKVLAVPSAIRFVIIASCLSTCVLACKVITLCN